MILIRRGFEFHYSNYTIVPDGRRQTSRWTRKQQQLPAPPKNVRRAAAIDSPASNGPNLGYLWSRRLPKVNGKVRIPFCYENLDTYNDLVCIIEVRTRSGLVAHQ